MHFLHVRERVWTCVRKTTACGVNRMVIELNECGRVICVIEGTPVCLRNKGNGLTYKLYHSHSRAFLFVHTINLHRGLLSHVK